MATMLYQGHGSYRLTCKDGTCIYVDPWAGSGYDTPADLILVTHEHFDHTGVELMPRNPGCAVIRAADLHPSPSEYLSVNSHGVQVGAVQACNENHPEAECIGFVLELDGVSFYASGDTSMTEDMRSGKLAAMGLDYAVLCGDGVFNMSAEQASECAKLVDARHSIPVHLVPVYSPDDAHDAAKLFDEEKAGAFRASGKITLHPAEELELE